MNRIYILFFMAFSINCFSQSQLDMNFKTLSTYEIADKELNDIYQQILTEYKSDKTFIKHLRQSQRIWIKFRDAELAMKYPKREPGYYGSIHPTCINIYMLELTKNRNETLRTWLDGSEEGDSCSGSVNGI